MKKREYASFSYNHRLHNKRIEPVSQMNGMIFQRDWTPHMEHFILTFRHQECWHRLNPAGLTPQCLWSRIHLLHYPFFLSVLWWKTPGGAQRYSHVSLFPGKSWWNHPRTIHDSSAVVKKKTSRSSWEVTFKNSTAVFNSIVTVF